MAATDPIVIPLIIDGKQVTPTLREMEAELKKLNKELKDLPIGSEEFNKKSQQLDQTRQRFDEVRNATAGARVEGTKMLDTIRNLGPGGQFIGNLADRFNGVKEGAEKGGAGVLSFGKALIGIPILAVVAAIAALLEYFQKTDEGATRLAGIMAALKTSVGLLTKPLIDLGKWLFDAFENPKKAGEDFMQFLQDQFMNRLMSVVTAFKAVGAAFQFDFAEASKLAADAAGQFILGVNNITDKVADMAGEMAKAAKDAYELENALDGLADRERDFSVQAKEAENQIQRLLLQAKNKGLAEEERLAILDRASALEERLHEQEVAFARENLALVQRKNALLLATGENTDEMAQAETDAKLKILELDGKSIELQEKIANRRSALAEQIEADKALELAAIEKAYDDELRLEEYFEKALLAQEKTASDGRKLAKDATDAEAKLALEQKFFGQIDAQNQYEEELYQLERAAKVRRLAEIEGDGAKERLERAKLQSEILKGDSDHNARLIANFQKTEDLKAKLRQVGLSGAQSALQMGIQFLSQDEENRKKYGAAIKALSIAEITVNLFKELSAIGYFSASNPLNAVTFGAAGATQNAILTALAIGRAGLGIATVSSQKFARGGVTNMLSRGGISAGSRHSEGGIQMIDRRSGIEVGEMEGGEAILTRGVVNNPYLRAAASRINVMGGGRAFADGGLAPGGSGVEFLGDPSAAVVEELRGFRSEISNWQRNLQVTNNITNMNKKQAEYEKMIQNSSI